MWHHCRQVFTSCSASQSRPLPFFPPGRTFLVATTIACCPCHSVRVISTFAVWQSGEICEVIAAAAFTLFNYALWSSSREDGLIFVQSCSLATMLPASQIPSSWPDTAFPLLTFVATGLLGHAGGWHLRRKPCVFPLLFLLDFSAPVGFYKVFQAATEKCLSLHALWKCQGLGSTLNCFWGLPHFSCPHRTRPFILGTLGCAQKSRLLVALCLVPLFVDYESSELPQDCFVVLCLLAHQCIFSLSHLQLLWHSLSHDRLGVPMEALLDAG